MAASVRLEDMAFSDPRYAALGELAGFNHFEALGRMSHLYRYCTQRRVYVVSEVIIRACLGPRGVEAIVGAELGERTEGGIRVRGTAGRIEWLENANTTASAGGKARAATATRGPDGRMLPRRPQPAGPAETQPNAGRVGGPQDSRPDGSDSPESQPHETSRLGLLVQPAGPAAPAVPSVPVPVPVQHVTSPARAREGDSDTASQLPPPVELSAEAPAGLPPELTGEQLVECVRSWSGWTCGSRRYAADARRDAPYTREEVLEAYGLVVEQVVVERRSHPTAVPSLGLLLGKIRYLRREPECRRVARSERAARLARAPSRAPPSPALELPLEPEHQVDAGEPVRRQSDGPPTPDFEGNLVHLRQLAAQLVDKADDSRAAEGVQ